MVLMVLTPKVDIYLSYPNTISAWDETDAHRVERLNLSTSNWQKNTDISCAHGGYCVGFNIQQLWHFVTGYEEYETYDEMTFLKKKEMLLLC